MWSLSKLVLKVQTHTANKGDSGLKKNTNAFGN